MFELSVFNKSRGNTVITLKYRIVVDHAYLFARVIITLRRTVVTVTDTHRQISHLVRFSPVLQCTRRNSDIADETVKR